MGFWGLGFGVRGLGFGVWGLGFGVRGLGFRVWGLGVLKGFRGSDKAPGVQRSQSPYYRGLHN